MDYAALIQKISDWLNRDDLADEIPGFIALFEERFNRIVRSREVTTLWAVTAGSYALPGDFRRLRKACLNASPNQQLVQVAPDEAVRLFGGIAGTPQAYSIEGDEDGVPTLYLYPAGDASLRVTYFSKLPALSITNTSNWLIEDNSDLYLAGALFYATSFIDDPDQSAKFDAYVTAALDELTTALRNDKWSGPLAPLGPAQVRGARC